MSRLNAQQLYLWSRRRDVLIRASAAILLGSLVVAWLIWWANLAFGGGGRLFDRAEEAVAVTREAPVWMVRTWSREPFLKGPLGAPDLTPVPESTGAPSDPVQQWVRRQVLERLPEADLGVEIADLLALYTEARYGDERLRGRISRELEEEGESGRPFAFELAGDLALLEKQPQRARELFRRELDLRPSRYAAGVLLQGALRADGEGNEERLRKLRQDERVWNAVEPALQLRAAAELRDWSALAIAVLRTDYLENRWTLVGLSIAVATVWFVIVTQFAGFESRQWPLYGASVVLGLLSATATIYVVVIQEHVLEVMRPGGDVLSGILYYVAGVGLREELLKLLFFVPLLPWLIRRGRAIDAVVSAGLVGLGFSLNENLGYFHRGGESSAVGRLLTANIAHVSWTGLIGFTLFRVVWFKGRYWDEVVGTFLVVVLAHGFYDALIGVPQLAREFGIGAMIILALSVWKYFDVTESHFRPSGVRISVLAVFVLGTALMVGLTFNLVVFGQRPFPAGFYFLISAVELLPVAFIFIHRFRET